MKAPNAPRMAAAPASVTAETLPENDGLNAYVF